MDCTRDILAKSGSPTFNKRGEDADQKLLARDVIGVPDLRDDRREVVFVGRIWIIAAIHHHAAKREMHEVGSFKAAPWPVIAKRRHPRDDESGKALSERIARKAELPIQPTAARIHEN